MLTLAPALKTTCNHAKDEYDRHGEEMGGQDRTGRGENA